MATDQRTNPVFDYATPQESKKRKRPWVDRAFRWSVWACGVSVLLMLALALLGGFADVPDAVFSCTMALFFTSMFVFFVFSTFRGYLNYRDARWRDDDDIAWHRYEQAKKALLQAAKTHMNLAPAGKWRLTVVASTSNYATVVAAGRSIGERMIEFLPDGTGRYYHLLGGVRFETIFAYKPGKQPFSIFVRMISPSFGDDWHLVEFGYETFRDEKGSPQLRIWFESDQPLSPDQREFWPFWGDLPQVSDSREIGDG